jgi:hypothetical protein
LIDTFVQIDSSLPFRPNETQSQSRFDEERRQMVPD